MKYLIYKILLLIISTKKSIQKLTIEENATSFPVSECIAYILKNYFLNIAKMSIRLTSKQNNLATELIKQIDLPVLVNVDEIPKIRGVDKRLPDDVSLIMDESFNVTKVLNRTLMDRKNSFYCSLQ